MTDTLVYCGHPGCGPAKQLIGWLRGGAAPPPWPGFERGEVVLTHSGRAAIALAARAWGLGPGDEVLVPSYNCGAEIDPIAATGATLVPYRVDERADIDLDDLTRRATERTRVVYVTHYFGWPQDLSELAAWCRRRGTLLLEDAALALFSAPIDHPIGASGDAVIYSLQKSLAVPDGGALVLRRGEARMLHPPAAPHFRTILRASLSLARNALVDGAAALGAYPLLAHLPGAASRPRPDDPPPSRPDIPARYYFDAERELRRISRLTAGLLQTVDPRTVITRRRENYTMLRDAIADAPGVRLLFDALPPGVCPLTMPVRVDDRHFWRRALVSRRIATIPWWSGYHRALSWDDFPEACTLKDTIVGLPIHHQLTGAHMRAIGEAVCDIAQRAASDQARAQAPARHAVPITAATSTTASPEQVGAS
ncbi:MAG: aminotransferase class V-fold PLP-dependent enzyme [Planctomycetota bacterium]|nr:aminotransferase class V-fold PLP-dependent enzyme [Planctomycetota bacterium]